MKIELIPLRLNELLGAAFIGSSLGHFSVSPRLTDLINRHGIEIVKYFESTQKAGEVELRPTG
jgi:hypothetical protein